MARRRATPTARSRPGASPSRSRSRTLPKHFAADGDLILSHVAAGLSAVFPDGEDFFVRSVRHFRDQITDPELKRQVAGFIGQEAMHGREHRAFNDRLARARLPDQARRAVHQVGPRRCASGSRRRRPTSPPPPPSSTSPPPSPSCAHRARRRATCSATTRCSNLFLWHALEESEHKAVAFDVYKAVGGTERMRVVDDELPTLRLRRRHDRPGRSSRCCVDRATYRRGNLRRSWRTLPPLADHAAASCGDQLQRLQPARLPPRRPRHHRARRAVARRAVRRPRARSTTSSPRPAA